MRNRYTFEHYKYIQKNIKNPEKKLVEMFNKEFDIKINIGILGNIKTKLGLKSGLVGGRFEKGMTAINKGKKWDDFMSKKGQKNSLKTAFKKGNIPHNHRNVGSERITKYGYVEIKVSEPNSWKPKHKYIYEKINGPIPKGHKLIFLDGNKSNVSIENLKLVSSEQLLIMNKKHYFTGNKELTKTGVVISKLMCKTNELKRRNKK